MILHTEDPELIEKLMLSGWAQGQDLVTFYWPRKLPNC